MSELILSNPDVFNSLTPYKKAILTLERTMDYSIEVASLQLDMALERKELELKEANLQVLVEDGTEEMLDSLYMEAEEKSSGGVVNALKNICDSVINFLKKSADMIAEKINAVLAKFKAKHVTPEDWEKSSAGKIALSYDYQKKMNEIESKMTEGQKLIREVSRKTSISEGKIRGYIQTVNNLISNIPQLTMKVVKAGAVVGGTVILFRNWRTVANGVAGAIGKCTGIFKRTKEDVGKHPKEEKEVLSAMSKLSKEYNKIGSRVSLGLCAIMNPGKNAIKNAAMNYRDMDIETGGPIDLTKAKPIKSKRRSSPRRSSKNNGVINITDGSVLDLTKL